ncbi:MAG: 4-hydroxy-3-methylbut-2-enyl diphosphate reductase [Alphaproteobacteria bacterium]|nr:4-hydroxy-3-methylbut-2-enyl diphosphate reductase [Alphaproteobacteria bacterium]
MAERTRIILAQPRGFCAGVERAIEIVERALQKFGPPVYVRHEIVHNRHVVESLRAKGARFVETLDEVPAGQITIFSAHGVARTVENEAGERGLHVIDATCPLVSKVHIEGRRYSAQGREVILIGHEGHPEVEGTMGQIPGGVHLISAPEDVARLNVRNPEMVAYVTQTTLSVDDTCAVIEALKRRFPAIIGPDTKDICYATQNRQGAVRNLADQVDLVLVVGAPNSSNSNRLREIAAECGKPAYLIEDASQLQTKWLENTRAIGITAGASAPDGLVQDLIAALGERGPIDVSVLSGIEENVRFRMPAELADSAA